jgi:catalase
MQAKASEGGFVSYHERTDAQKVRARSQSFFDHFSQATLFFNSQSEAEKNHIIAAFRFELGKLENPAIRERVVGMLTRVDKILAEKVAAGLGMAVPRPAEYLNQNIPADGDPKKFQPVDVHAKLKISKALSMADTVKDTIKTRQIAILAEDGMDGYSLNTMKQALEAAGAITKIIASHLGHITAVDGKKLKVDQSFLTAASVLFDAVYVPGGAKSADLLKKLPDAVQFINEAFKHCKAIAAEGAGVEFIQTTDAGKNTHTTGKDDKTEASNGVLINGNPNDFIKAIAQHRFWQREKQG